MRVLKAASDADAAKQAGFMEEGKNPLAMRAAADARWGVGRIASIGPTIGMSELMPAGYRPDQLLFGDNGTASGAQKDGMLAMKQQAEARSAGLADELRAVEAKRGRTETELAEARANAGRAAVEVRRSNLDINEEKIATTANSASRLGGQNVIDRFYGREAWLRLQARGTLDGSDPREIASAEGYAQKGVAELREKTGTAAAKQLAVDSPLDAPVGDLAKARKDALQERNDLAKEMDRIANEKKVELAGAIDKMSEAIAKIFVAELLKVGPRILQEMARARPI